MPELLIKLLGALTLGYFSQPQVRVFYKKGASSSGGASGNPDGIECDWKGNLVFENLTSTIAQNLTLQGLPVGFRMASMPNYSLKPYETRETELVIRKTFPRQIVINCQDRFTELLPPELKNLRLVVSYQNLKGIKFYTKYARNLDYDKCTYHFSEPKSE